MSTIWVIAAAVFGAIVGSFLNVVIFRLPRGLSVSEPRWSFCPHCQSRIRFRDNIPILGWLWLRGRCRDCSAPIGIVYPIVEAVAAFLFVAVVDAMFIGKVWPLIGDPESDWPAAFGFISLFAVLLAIAAMDIESYAVDVRVLVFGMFVGVCLTAVWFVTADPLGNHVAENAVHSASRPGSPLVLRSGLGVQPATPPTGVLSAPFALIASAMGVSWWLWETLATQASLGARAAADVNPDSTSAGEEAEDVSDAPTDLNAENTPFNPMPVFLMVLVVLGYAIWLIVWPHIGLTGLVPAPTERGLLGLGLLMAILLFASVIHRESDRQIIEEIEAERLTARRVAMGEARSLLPAVIAGLGVFLYLRQTGRLGSDWSDFLGDSLAFSATGRAAAGALTALGSLVWAAAFGWFVRIAGTLGFGKEAYGSGDIFIMAAMGAVMGVWGLVFGFFLAALLAIIGVLAMSFWKSSRAVPFGPWLAMGAFATLWLHADLLRFFEPIGTMLLSILAGVPAAI
ncbi:MAG: prepilin peptidase [Phycisphaerae bacterium]|nr:prepilin peptidase [Phycisphaerae bacterium]